MDKILKIYSKMLNLFVHQLIERHLDDAFVGKFEFPDQAFLIISFLLFLF